MIDTVLRAVGSNVGVAAAIALVAFGVSRWSRRPALAHTLWLLVLLKLVTPPVVSLPLGAPTVTEITVERANVPTPPVAMPPALEPVVFAAPPQRSVAPAPRPVDWRVALLALWGVGSLALAVRTGVRAWRFHRLLADAPAAPPELRDRVAALARRLGLRAPPRLVLLEGRLPPMLWAVGRPTIAVPRSLVAQFAAAELDVVLAHELAHLRRGDHRVRLLEVASVIAFWWLPLVWWARRALRRAEEECCDAWVVWAEPDHGEVYARALVKTLAFLSGDRVPSLACGVRHLGPMKRRLSMILECTPPRRLSTVGRTAAIAFAATLLTIAPTIAQDEHAAERERLAKQIAHVDRAMRELKMARLPSAIESLAATRARLVARAKALGARIVSGAAKVRALESEVERLDREVATLETKLAKTPNATSEELDATKLAFDRIRAERNAATERLADAWHSVDPDRIVDARHELETVKLEFRGIGGPPAPHDRPAKNAQAIAELKTMIAKLSEENARLARRMAALVPKAAERRATAAEQLAQLYAKQTHVQEVLRDTRSRLHEAEESGSREAAEECRHGIEALLKDLARIEKRIHELRTKGGRAQ